jgi:glutathione peroxidase
VSRGPGGGLYDLEVTTIAGVPQRMEVYRGHVLLIVNVASHCGYTPQYEGLEALWRRYRARGLTVLGFPCDQFGHQEPGDEAAIAEFCSQRYQVTFPMFSKVAVNGRGAHPLFKLLKSKRSGVLGSQSIKWNFTKFLVGRDGLVVGRFGSRDTPAEIEKVIVPLVAQEPAG